MVELGFITVCFLLVTTLALADVINGLEERGKLGKSSTFSARDGFAGSLDGLFFFFIKFSAELGLEARTEDIPGNVGKSSSLDLAGGLVGCLSCLILPTAPPGCGTAGTGGAPGKLGNSSSRLGAAPDLLDQD